MVNNGLRSGVAVMLLAVLVLTAAAWLRSAEYDEQYTLFVTAGSARPAWPEDVFPAGRIVAIQAGQGSMTSIAHDLRTTDVHPPLYFWVVRLWRDLVGPGLFAARLFSILCGLVSLTAVWVLARRCGIDPVVAMPLTLGSYGFTYTAMIARGFALAQALTLFGVVLLTGRPRRLGVFIAGVLLGSACACNYLAVFVATVAGVLVGGWLVLAGALPFLALDGWFFAAQHAARDGQFPPFALGSALARLGGYQVATVFGGLPLYVDGLARTIACAAVGVLAVATLLTVLWTKPLSAGPRVRMLLAAAAAPPAGLLLLGAMFNNTPIELRYLSFGVPFIALLVARAGRPLEWGVASGWPRPVSTTPGYHHRDTETQRISNRGVFSAVSVALWRPLTAFRRHGRPRADSSVRRVRLQTLLLAVVLMIQAASIAGLIVAPVTMQPARATAAAAARLAQGGVVLLPRGNDGVGIVGAFGVEAPASLLILLVSPSDPPGLIDSRIAAYRRVVLARMTQDHDAGAALPVMRAAVTGPGWRRVATGFNVEVYERTGEGM